MIYSTGEGRRKAKIPNTLDSGLSAAPYGLLRSFLHYGYRAGANEQYYILRYSIIFYGGTGRIFMRESGHLPLDQRRYTVWDITGAREMVIDEA